MKSSFVVIWVKSFFLDFSESENNLRISLEDISLIVSTFLPSFLKYDGDETRYKGAILPSSISREQLEEVSLDSLVTFNLFYCNSYILDYSRLFSIMLKLSIFCLLFDSI